MLLDTAPSSGSPESPGSRARSADGTSPEHPVPRRRNSTRALGLLLSCAALLLIVLLSLMVGSRSMSPGEVWHGLFHATGTADDVVVGEVRVPRTLLGVLAGAGLGLAGSVMQALTRNPLADPGLLGINAGASAAVVTATSFLGVTSLTGYVWFAFLGAGTVSVLVYAIGGSRAATPVRLALAGTAVTAALFGYINAVQLLDSTALEKMRFWTVGSLASANSGIVVRVAPFLLAGVVLALALARPLNALALGEDAARALGANLTRTRALAMVTVTLLCGAATAACGPIVFIGLMVPHLVRALTGPDQRWILPCSAVLAPVLLLGADVLGRVVTRPAELQVGIVTALVGGVLFVHLVRRRKVAQL
ncbi:FecCD family ABC transporter permease [Streptomyces gamaensis]|uniref:FecCD family ABC transporter permease n=1 Tax=Streptomyces gamaensis TaxID=1763542 RepID=A0ABW0Z2D6_9ACTN